MEDARASEKKYNEILNSGMPHPACQLHAFGPDRARVKNGKK